MGYVSVIKWEGITAGQRRRGEGSDGFRYENGLTNMPQQSYTMMDHYKLETKQAPLSDRRVQDS
jgi:hypothetical protein